MKALKVLLLGSKEYPLGSSAGEDAFTSGGIEAFVENLADELAKRRDTTVTLVTRKFARTPEFERKGRLRVVRVNWLKGFFLRNPSFNLAAFCAAKKIDCDIVHAHGPVATFFASFLGKPLVATPHGIASGQPQYGTIVNALLRRLERRAYSRADCIVFLSEQEKQVFARKLGFLPKRCAVIPPGIDSRKYSPRKNAAAGAAGAAKRLRKQLCIEGKFVAAFVGRLIAVKGVRYAVEAIALLESRQSKQSRRKLSKPIVFLIAGNGPERAALEQQAMRLGVRDKVFFLGERRDVPTVLAASDCFVLPSLSEGLPVALLEAMACGVPCVVTDIGLPAEDKKNALVVPPRNAGALAKAIRLLLEDRALAKKLVANARAFVTKKFSLKQFARAHAELYARLLESTSRD